LSPSLSTNFETKVSKTIHCLRDVISNLSCVRGERSHSGEA